MKFFDQRLSPPACLLLFLIAVDSQILPADVIWLKGSAEPVVGRILDEKGDQIEIQFADRTIQKIPRNKIVASSNTVSDTRLEQLTASDWMPYFELAEELSVEKADPVAHELAIRLLLIVAANADLQLRESALSGLAQLGRNEREQSRFRLLKRMRSQSTDLAIRPPQSQSVSRSRLEQSRQRLLEGIQSIRRGGGDRATKLLTSKEIEHALPKVADVCSRSELIQMSRLNRLSLAQLSKLLKAELILRGEKVQTGNNDNQNWGYQAAQQCRVESELPTLENVTEFDPNQSVFRGGRWIQPETTDD